MAIYTFTSGIESESVGQYSSELLSSLANRTIGSFTLKTARGLFGFISSDERRTYAYHPAVINIYTEIDYGSINSVHAQALDQGSLTNRNATQVDYGRIIYVTNVESFGFVKVVNEASWKATNSYLGTGTAFTFGNQTAPGRYAHIADGKVRCSGTADSAFSPASESRGGLSLRGNSAIGITAITSGSGQIFSSGLKSESRTKVYPLGEEILDLVITPDELASYNRNIVNVSLYNGGDGTGSYGGFDIGRHYRFNLGNANNCLLYTSPSPRD